MLILSTRRDLSTASISFSCVGPANKSRDVGVSA